jgi:hypothetical protein
MAAEMYRISATPVLHSQGDFKGKLKGVSFTAASPTDTKEWYGNNCGQFELAFSKIMPASQARAIVATLTRGDDVEFPGEYRERAFECGFLFEWPSFQLSLPHDFFPGMASA